MRLKINCCIHSEEMTNSQLLLCPGGNILVTEREERRREAEERERLDELARTFCPVGMCVACDHGESPKGERTGAAGYFPRRKLFPPKEKPPKPICPLR